MSPVKSKRMVGGVGVGWGEAVGSSVTVGSVVGVGLGAAVGAVVPVAAGNSAASRTSTAPAVADEVVTSAARVGKDSAPGATQAASSRASADNSARPISLGVVQFQRFQ